MVKVHFLNVGHGDCTIIEHESGNITMIDINNGDELDEESAAEITEQLGYARESLIEAIDQQQLTPYEILQKVGYAQKLTNPVEFYKGNYGNKDIFRYVQTHPDLDHMRGLVALRKENIAITNFWDTKHSKSQDDFLFDDEEEWKEYLEHRKGNRAPTVLNLERGSVGKYYNQHPLSPLLGGDGLHIIAPTKELTDEANNSEKWNNHSYVLWFAYKGVSVVFGGDAETEVWDSIVAKYGAGLSCYVLKASHHGRDSGYHPKAVELMKPIYTVVSVGKKPETDASNKYKKDSTFVWSTRWKGNIHLTIDDNGKFKMDCQYPNN